MKHGTKSTPKKRIARGTRGSRHAPPTNAVKKGQVLNPFGAPRKGMSYAEIYRTLNSCTVGEIGDLLRAAGGCPELEAALKRMPKTMPMKILKGIRTSIANAMEPSSGLLQFEAEREEGKVPDKLQGRMVLEIREAPVALTTGAKPDAGKAHDHDS